MPQPLTFGDDTWRIQVDPVSGGLLSISHAADPHGMNWLACPDEQTWLPFSKLWGLGVIGLDHGWLYGRSRWERAAAVVVEGARMSAVYRLSKGFTITVERRLVDGELEESYTFANTGFGGDHTIGGLGACAFGVYLPFNDNYPDAATCLTRRCNTHLWCGGASSWVNAIRMGAVAPHLGLVVTDGGFAGYSVQERDSNTFSNVRGAFLIHPERSAIPAGGSTRIAWRLFWHDGWEAFWRRVEATPGFVRITASALSVETGSALALRASGLNGPAEVTIDGSAVPATRSAHGLHATVPVATDGQHVVTVRDARGVHRLHAWGRPAMLDLISRRLDFIRRRQRIAEGRFAGGYLCYDNRSESCFADPRYNGELLGMGILAALWQQHEPHADLLAELHDYAAFVERCWLMPNGDVRTTHFEAGMEHIRLYSYGWAAHWLCEYAFVTNDDAPLHRAMQVIEAYHRRGGAGFYAIGLPYLRLGRLLDQRGLGAEAARLRTLALSHAASIARTGTAYPKHEVNFEQTIVGPAVEILLNVHLLTGDPAWREAARVHQTLLDAFNGQQPDHRLNDIAIRHWDGFFGGEDRRWGDTFPHYWSGLTGWISALWSASGGGPEAAARARHILIGNASLFTRDGHATGAHIYPAQVDGREAACDDRAATDQDWPLVWWLMLRQVGVSDDV